MNELTLAELKASQSGLPRVRQMKKRKDQSTLVGISAYEVGKTTTWSTASLDLSWVNLLTFYLLGS